MQFSFDESLSTAREVIEDYSSEEFQQTKQCSSLDIPEIVLDDCTKYDAPINPWSMNSSDYEIGQAIGISLDLSQVSDPQQLCTWQHINQPGSF